MSFLLGFLYSQLFYTPTYPTTSYASKTVIVTGSNIGLGLEAARHFTRLGASRVILACRSTSKAATARSSIEDSTRIDNVVEVWPLDLSSYDSVREFAERCSTLERLDVLVENAGVIPSGFHVAEEDEITLTTNVISTFLLALLVLPVLRRTAQQFNTQPRLVIVASEVHFLTNFPERHAPNIFATLNDPKTANISDRYNVSKLIEVLVVRHLASKMMPKVGDTPEVVLNCVNPGLCHSALARNASGLQYYALQTIKALLARTTEVGSRTLVDAAGKGTESHGTYLSDCRVTRRSSLVESEEGQKAGDKIWGELAVKLDRISPGILENIGHPAA